MKQLGVKDVTAGQKTGRIEQACLRYGVGRNTMRQIAEEAEAVIKIGKCYIINFSKVDNYMDAISGKGRE